MRRAIPVFLIISLACACAHPARFVYPTTRNQVRQVSDGPKYRLRVAVLPFEEMRESGNSVRTFWICLLPLAPFGFVALERPETAAFFNTVSSFEFDASRDMAKAVTTSLEESRLFSDVSFASEGDVGDADLIVSGKVKRTRYLGRTYTYCISAAGAVLWVLGLPVGDSTDELEFTLEVRHRRNGNRIWGCRSQSTRRIVQGLYYRWGEDVQGFSDLMTGAMQEVVSKLVDVLDRYEKERTGMRRAP